MPQNMNNKSNGISDELSEIRAEIVHRNDKIDELIMDIADEMKILKRLLKKEQELFGRHEPSTACELF